MNHSYINVAAGRAFGRAGAILLVTLSVAASTCGAAGQGVVPAEFHGTWVPSKSSCESPVKVLVAADRLTLVSGKDNVALGGIEMAGPDISRPNTVASWQC